MPKPKIICWDLDFLLGNFESFSRALTGEPLSPDIIGSWGLRPGIKETLERLAHENYMHTITTTALEWRTQELMNRLGTGHYFSKIYTRETITTDKDYIVVMAYFGLSLEEAQKRMVIIGDGPGDRPDPSYGAAGIVFILEQNLYHDAVLFEHILADLLAKGDGSFNRGFQAIYGPLRTEERPLFSGGKYAAYPPLDYISHGNISLVLQYIGTEGSSVVLGEIGTPYSLVPQITVKEAEAYRKPLEPVNLLKTE
ncbi:HAD hydrolase-like protein [Candidatus Woesearchaeota archaeon]|nr:HAD hydrolase-like protein [Candidatus Woesearchaeota archaeon]